MGCLLLADVPRPEAQQAIADLRSLGVRRVLLLTGDRREVAEEIGDRLEVDETIAELLPRQKLEIIECEFQASIVMMVGDMAEAGWQQNDPDGKLVGLDGSAPGIRQSIVVVHGTLHRSGQAPASPHLHGTLRGGDRVGDHVGGVRHAQAQGYPDGEYTHRTHDSSSAGKVSW